MVGLPHTPAAAGGSLKKKQSSLMKKSPPAAATTPHMASKPKTQKAPATTPHKAGKPKTPGRNDGVQKQITSSAGGKRKAPDNAVVGKGSSQDSSKGRSKKKKGKGAGAAGGGTAASGGALHPFEHDPADDCETCFAAYQDICPFLTKLAQRLGKSKHELCIWDPYYCAGKVKAHLRKLGFTNVVNDNKDFYAMTPEEQPPFDVLLTSPPYSKDHIQKCMEFAVNGCNKAWFILQPQYVHRKAYYSTLVSSVDPFFMVPGREYVYYAHHGGRKDNTKVVCRHWARDGKCPRGDDCAFFHGILCVCVCVYAYIHIHICVQVTCMKHTRI